jgi:hypothetical protein
VYLGIAVTEGLKLNTVLHRQHCGEPLEGGRDGYSQDDSATIYPKCCIDHGTLTAVIIRICMHMVVGSGGGSIIVG